MAASAGRFLGPVSSVVLRTSHLSAVSEGIEVSPPLSGYSWLDQLWPSDPSGPIRLQVPETENQGWWGNLELWHLTSPTRTREANDGVCPCEGQSGPDGTKGGVCSGSVWETERPAPSLLWLRAPPDILTANAPILYSRTSGLLLLYPVLHLLCPSPCLVNTGC